MRVLLLSRYTRLGASSRLRTAQYIPFLKQKNIFVENTPFFDDDYLISLYSDKKPNPAVLSHFTRRLVALRRKPSPELIWLEYEAFPWLLWALERLLLPKGIPIVTDYDDAVFHRYDQHGNTLVRWLLGRKIDHVMAASVMVMAGNAYLAERARSAGADDVRVVPTVLDIENYSARTQATCGANRRIGWIGTPSTWSAYMAPMMPLLGSVAEAHGARLSAVGAGTAAAPHPLLDNLLWSEETEVARIREMDVGIMPLTDTPWAHGKCGYKLIQYMACGLPVIASPVGVNTEIVEHGVNGFLVSTDEDWRAALSTVLRDRELRQRMGAEGRRKIEQQYSLQVWGPRVAAMLRDAALRGRTG